jgi:hypothetical protein
MKKTLSIALAYIISAFIGISCNIGNTDLPLKIYSTVGNVTVLSSGGEKTPKEGDIINAGDSIRTGALSCADIIMGNLGLIRVQENSLVKIDTLVDPATGDTKFSMNQGKIYSTLGKLSKGSFQVQTPTSVASIRGTSFKVSAAANDSRLDVLDGNVHVNPVQNNTVITDVETMVGTNQTISLDKQTVLQAIQKRGGLKVAALRKDEIQKIRDEIKNIRPELIEKLRRGARNEFNTKVFDTVKKKREDAEKSKIKRQEFLKSIKEKNRVNREKFKNKLEDRKQALKDKLEKLKEKKAGTQKNPLRKRNPAGAMSL